MAPWSSTENCRGSCSIGIGSGAVSKLPGGGGESNSCLADLKFITGIMSRYPRNPQPRDEPKRAVQRRANLVNKEYEKHAVKLDVRHNGVPKAGRGEVQETGPVQQKLGSHGVWGEASGK